MFRFSYKHRKIVLLILSILLVSVPYNANAQRGNLEKRVTALEDYVDKIPEEFMGFSDEMRSRISRYTNKLEANLETYSKNLQLNLEERFEQMDKRLVILNPTSQSYQTIETNSGKFLISVDKMEPIADGIRLHLQIGNSSYADYRNFTLRILWGRRWNSSYAVSREQWRKELIGREYNFTGLLQKGYWNPIKVDLVPSTSALLGHIEIEMDVGSIELLSK